MQVPNRPPDEVKRFTDYEYVGAPVLLRYKAAPSETIRGLVDYVPEYSPTHRKVEYVMEKWFEDGRWIGRKLFARDYDRYKDNPAYYPYLRAVMPL